MSWSKGHAPGELQLADLRVENAVPAVRQTQTRALARSHQRSNQGVIIDRWIAQKTYPLTRCSTQASIAVCGAQCPSIGATPRGLPIKNYETIATQCSRIGFSNAPFSSPRHPEYGRTGEQGRDAAPDVLESAGRDLLASCWVLMAQPKFASPGCRLRVVPCLRAASIGPENPRTPPTPAALVAGSPELSRSGSLRPLAGPGHGPAPGAAHAPATPGA